MGAASTGASEFCRELVASSRRPAPVEATDFCSGATVYLAAAFRNAGARLVPVPVDGDGLDLAKALRACPQPRGVYVTPAHQFPLGMTMSLERRLALLGAARRSDAQVI
jgi:hypothetical protein